MQDGDADMLDPEAELGCLKQWWAKGKFRRVVPEDEPSLKNGAPWPDYGLYLTAVEEQWSAVRKRYLDAAAEERARKKARIEAEDRNRADVAMAA